MKATGITISLFLAVLIFAAFGTPPNDTRANPSANATKSAPAAPTVDVLLALDRQATKGYLQGDAKLFEVMLSDQFQMREGGRALDKAAAIRMIAGNRCDVKDWQLEDPRMAQIDADTYVVSYQGSFAGSCSGPDRKSVPIRSPVRAATVWARSGDRWLAVFHGENLIVDPRQPPPASKMGKKDGRGSVGADAAASRPPDPITSALLAAEKNVWEAWRVKDAKRLEDLTAKDLSFQNIFGVFFSNKAETLKDWTGTNCDIQSVSVTDGAGRSLSPTLGMLTHKGTAEGTCAGQKLDAVPVYGTSIYVKDGDSWKLAFTLNRSD